MNYVIYAPGIYYYRGGKAVNGFPNFADDLAVARRYATATEAMNAAKREGILDSYVGVEIHQVIEKLVDTGVA